MILFVDTETSGMLNYKQGPEHPSQPHIVQLAASLESGPRVIRAQINFIVRAEEWEIEPEAEAVHHISNAISLLYGVSRKTALAVLNHLARLSSVLVAHNLDFDNNILLAQYYREGQRPVILDLEHFCTMKAATPILKLPKAWRPKYPKKGDEYKWPSLAELYSYLFPGETIAGAHDAMVDVRAVSRCYWELLERGLISPPSSSR